MTVDERIERLAERHAALTESVELLAHRTDESARNIQAIIVGLNKDAENIRALARIAEAHETRIEHLEGDQA